MANQQRSSQSASRQRAGGGPAPPPPQPNINPEVLQRLVDQAAHFNMLSIPDSANDNLGIASRRGSNAVVGMNVSEVLHRFDVRFSLPLPKGH